MSQEDTWKSLHLFEEFRVLLKEVKAVVNSRPMTALPSDPGEPQALTPTCLLFGYATTQLPYPLVEADEPFDESVSLSRMARRRAMLFTHFVNRFQHEYLAAFRERHSHQQTQFHVSVRPLVGDLVLIHDESLPRTRWKLGVIEDLLTGPDKIPRAAIVRTTCGWTSRPLSRLYPVEDTNKVEEPSSKKEMQEQHAQPPEETQKPPTCSRPARRAAAKLANQLLEQMT